MSTSISERISTGHYSKHLETPKRSKTSDYLSFSGKLLSLVGAFYFVCSIAGMSLLASQDVLMQNFRSGLLPFAVLGEETKIRFQDVVAAYIVGQIFMGWVLGLFTFAAAYYSWKGRYYGFVKAVCVLNWVAIPVGTTVGLILYSGLDRADVRHAFGQDVQLPDRSVTKSSGK